MAFGFHLARTGRGGEDAERDARNEAAALEAAERVLSGDDGAFRVIVETYGELLAGVVGRRVPLQEVQDVVQDAFVRAYRALPGFRRECPLRVWLVRIAKLAAADHWRRQYRNREVSMSDFDEAGLVGVERAAAAGEAVRSAEAERSDAARELVEAAMARISPEDRAVLTMTELEGKSMEEAAAELGCGISAVKVRAFRARKRLKKAVEAILSEGKESEA
jgi:RNA polymerase sigma-70 factor (ECF subfamily)